MLGIMAGKSAYAASMTLMQMGATLGLFTAMTAAKTMGIGLAVAGAASIAAFAATKSMMASAKDVGDFKMEAGKGPVISTTEGAFQLSKNDDLLAGPGIASQGSSVNITPVTDAINSLKTELAEIKTQVTNFNKKQLQTTITNRQLQIAMTPTNG